MKRKTVLLPSDFDFFVCL